MARYSPLLPWLDRTCPLRPFHELDARHPVLELGGFVAIDFAVPAHEVHALKPERLAASWKRVRKYVQESTELANLDESPLLDREESSMIIQELGPPPECCYPLYLLAVGSGTTEKVVYVGKTSSKSARFKSGHHAFLRLLDPEYAHQTKTLYQAAVMLLTSSRDGLPLEWVHPLEVAEELLLSVEAQLIFELQPLFNHQNTRRYNAAHPMTLHVKNFSDSSKLLDDVIIHPRNRGETR